MADADRSEPDSRPYPDRPLRFWKRVSETAVDVSDIASHVPHRDSSLESRLIASEQMTLVWESVAQLSDRQRSVFLLRFLEDWNYLRSRA